MARIVDVLKAPAWPPKRTPARAAITATGVVNDIHTSPYIKEAPPLSAASLSVNQKLPAATLKRCAPYRDRSGRLPGLRYQPGDALGSGYQNDPALVKELVELLWLKGDEPVAVENAKRPLSEALHWHFELTVNTANIVENYATLAQRIAAVSGR